MKDRSEAEEPLTTHAEPGAGDPRLLISREGGDRFVAALTMDEATLGSAEGNTIVLPGAEAVHATIVHDDRDEYVLTMHGPGLTNASNDTPSGEERAEVLRTGARFTLGDWTLVFTREEFADHGRPYGGREGGELSDQPPQPQRPDHDAADGDEQSERGEEVRDG